MGAEGSTDGQPTPWLHVTTPSTRRGCTRRGCVYGLAARAHLLVGVLRRLLDQPAEAEQEADEDEDVEHAQPRDELRVGAVGAEDGAWRVDEGRGRLDW
eukprot:5019972-Prymnesium_polylepis.1